MDRQGLLFGEEPVLITDPSGLVGKTILVTRKSHSKDKRVCVLQIGFTDNSYCILLSDNPSIGIHLMEDIERVLRGEAICPTYKE